MPKIRPLFMILTGIGLALLLWLVVIAVQGQTKNTRTPLPTDTGTSNGAAEVQTLSPANVLSVEQEGDKFTVRGVSMAGSAVWLSANARTVAQAQSDAQGQWQVEFSWQNKQTAQLDIYMLSPEGQQIRSSQTLFLIDKGGEGDAEFAEGSDGLSARKLILLAAPGAPSRVLQTPFESLPTVDGFNLEVIDYDNSGGAIFSGSSSSAGKVRIYANGALVGESSVDNAGRWRLIFGNIIPLGSHNISAELVRDMPGVNTRIELPFERMKPLLESENSPEVFVERFVDKIQVGRVLFGGGYQYFVVYSPEALSPGQ